MIGIKVPITEVSESFRATHSVMLSDLRELVIPVSAPLACEAYFESPRVTSGTRMLITFNGEDVAELVYDDEDGRKQTSVDVTDLLQEGENDFRVRCLTSCVPLADSGDDAGLVWLRTAEATIIKKRYSTKGSLEPFDQRWTLWYEPRTGGELA